jgi:purine-binding chemotaxis protein CheW
MTAPTAISQIVTFRLGDELFAADIFSVERVLRYTPPTPVPNVPAWIEGVIDYQGRVVPVINLRRRFELADATVAADARILVLTVEDEWVAAIVDGVLDVSALDPSRLAPPPALFRGLAASYLRGVVRRGDRLVVFLDVPRLMATNERIVLEHAEEPTRHG